MKLFPIAAYRKWLLGVIMLRLLVWGGVYVLLQKLNCAHSDMSCSHLLDIYAAFTWDFFLKAIIVSSFLLLFFSKRAFKWWRWFALVAIPYAVWDIATTKTDYGWFLSGSSPQLTSDIDGALFLVATLLIAITVITYGYFKNRRENKKSESA